MAQKERIYNLHEILAELKQSHGLPKQLSTEAQLWDEKALPLKFPHSAVLYLQDNKCIPNELS